MKVKIPQTTTAQKISVIVALLFLVSIVIIPAIFVAQLVQEKFTKSNDGLIATVSLGVFVLANMLGACKSSVVSLFHTILLVVSGILFLVYYDKLVRQNPQLKKKFAGRYAYGGIITYIVLALIGLVLIQYFARLTE